jgi:hypothetical protein
MAFLTIEPAASLSESELQRAIKGGPPEVALDAPHEQLLAAAGFVDIEIDDVTAEYSQTQQDWIDAWADREAELVDVLGAEFVNEAKTDRQAARSAIDDGLLRRTLYLARRSSQD